MSQTRYYFQWADLLANLTRSLDGIPLSSNSTGNHIHQWQHIHWFQWVMSQLDRPASLLRIESFFRDDVNTGQMKSCQLCRSHMEKWRDGIMKEQIQKMRKLSSFL